MSIIKLMRFGELVTEDKHFYEDYGQKYDTRQFFKHDFNKELLNLWEV